MNYARILRLVEQESGVELGPGREYLVRSRTAELASELSLQPEELHRRLPSDARLRRRLVEALLTSETFFFRDEPVFRALGAEIEARVEASARLTIWSAACSTGQEPWSLAMLCEELLGPRATRVRVLASDFSQANLERARAGSYSERELRRGLSEERRRRHFHRVGEGFRVEARLRSRVEFRRLDLSRPWPLLPRVDLLLMRNVLIYFSPSRKREILDRARRQLAPNGLLVQGNGEAPGEGLELEARRSGQSVLWRRVA